MTEPTITATIEHMDEWAREQAIDGQIKPDELDGILMAVEELKRFSKPSKPMKSADTEASKMGETTEDLIETIRRYIRSTNQEDERPCDYLEVLRFVDQLDERLHVSEAKKLGIIRAIQADAITGDEVSDMREALDAIWPYCAEECGMIVAKSYGEAICKVAHALGKSQFVLQARGNGMFYVEGRHD
jgi:hypothetical protein